MMYRPHFLDGTSTDPSADMASDGERNTRNDPVPREEHLTDEDWAIMAAVENCVVWKLLKSLNLRQREKLLAAICLTFKEVVEGTSECSTVGRPQDFVYWGSRWGTDEAQAQLILMNQWDNIFHSEARTMRLP